MTGGLILAGGLVLIALGTAARQAVLLRRVRGDRFLPPEDATYLRWQAARRLATAALMLVIGGMIAGSFLSGLEARMDNPAPGDRGLARFWGAYWLAVLLLVFAIMSLAVFDFWATRRYWLRQYRRIRDDHNARLQRDLAVHRQRKMNDREARIRGGLPPPAAGDAPAADAD